MLDKKGVNSTIYEIYGETLFRISMKYSNGDRMLAEDAVQETFLRYYTERKSGKVIKEDGLKNYLITIAKNYTLNVVKKTNKEILTNDIMPYCYESSLENDLEVRYFTQLRELEIDQYSIQLLSELKAYNSKWYYVIIQVFYYGKSQVEVSKELQVSKESIYAMISRIRIWGKQKKAVTLT